MAKKKSVTKKEVVKSKVGSLDVVKKAIEKKYGNVLMPMSDRPESLNTISTRSLGLDSALGRGGFALGRHYEVYGENSSGKTTLAMSVIAEAQSRGLSCVFIDAEHSADRILFESMGVDVNKLLIIDAFTGEKNLMIAETLMKENAIDLLVIDSVISLIPETMAENDLDKDSMALLARLMSRALLRLVPLAAETNSCVIWINQTRQKLGGYGNPETTGGGTALGFYATGRIRVSGVGAKANRLHDDSGNVIGHTTTFETVKNKLNAPFKKSSVNLYYGKGYDMVGEIINISTDLGLLEKSGSWYTYNEKSIGQGEAGVRRFFEENPDIYNIIKDEVTIILGLDPFYKIQKDFDSLRAPTK